MSEPCSTGASSPRPLRKPRRYERWVYRINYGEFITFDEFVALDHDIQNQYIAYLCYLGIRGETDLAECLDVDYETARPVAIACGLYGQLDCLNQLTKDMHQFEDGALCGYRGKIFISIRHAVHTAQGLNGDQRFLDGLRKTIKGQIELTHKFGHAKGLRPLYKTSRDTSAHTPAYHYPTSSEPKTDTSASAVFNKGDEPMKELYGIEKTIGKPIEKMDLNDIEKAASGCTLQPLHAKEEVLTEEYLRSLVFYFPHVIQCLVDKYLLNAECSGYMSKALKKYGIEHRGLSARTYLLEQVTFVLWATGDLQTALEYYDSKQKIFAAKKHNLPTCQPTTENEASAEATPAETAPTTEIPNKEEENMPETEPTVAVATEVKPRPKQATPIRPKVATIILDTTNPSYGKAIAALFSEYADLIVNFNQ